MRRLIGLWALLACLAGLVPWSGAAQAKAPPLRTHRIGVPDGATPGPVSGGLLLLGGGDRDAAAMRWFFEKAGHGHIVVLRASYGGEIGEEFYRNIGGVASVETFVFNDRAAAWDETMLARLRAADGIFIAGGDQARYVRFWKGSPVAAALDAHVAAGRPIAGTSAGLAILGEHFYGAADGGSITSLEALAAPLGPANGIDTDFLHIALLKGVITDTHFKERDRLGRLFAFLARAQSGRAADQPALIGLGVDENAAVAVEPDGRGRVFGPGPQDGAWLVDGAALRHHAGPGALDAPRVTVTRIGPQSNLHLPSGSVEHPLAVRHYAAGNGRLAEAAR